MHYLQTHTIMSETSFAKLREIGEISLEGGEEIRFSIDVYRGYRYVSIRRYLMSDSFSGATRAGITMTPEILRVLQPIIAALSDDEKQIKDGQLGKFAKRPGICIIASISTFKGSRGLDLRQWQEGLGWTKKGIRLPLEKLSQVKQLLAKTKECLDEKPEDDF